MAHMREVTMGLQASRSANPDLCGMPACWGSLSHPSGLQSSVLACMERLA